jgi:bla regulator protein blaR1
MDFLRLKIFPANLVDAIGSTLIHSLWQGVLLAVITGFIIVFTRKSSPAARYNLLIAALILFALGVAVTFIAVFKSPNTNSAYLQQKIAVTFQPAAIISEPTYPHVAIYQPTFKELTRGFINKNANSIVLVWFLIVCARSLQLASGLNGLYYLRRKSIFAIDERLENRVRELALKLGISQIVGIVESGMAKVPMVIGHLKPLILIPIGLITTLTEEEVEAILVHELAHVRRRDYLVNMLQSFMEIIFFFNPAVLWISALIKTERENCCDDIVVAQSSSKADYIKALVSCQEYRMSAPAYGMALTGNKNHLLTRVKRMLSNNNQSLNMMEKSLLAVCLVSAGLLTAAFSNADKINALVTKTAKTIAHITTGLNKKEIAPKTLPAKAITSTIKNIKTDTSKDTKIKIFRPNAVKEHASVSVQNNLFTTYLYKQDGILYQLNYRDKALNSMQVNGKSISNDHITSYQSIISQIQLKNGLQTATAPEKVEPAGVADPAHPSKAPQPASAPGPVTQEQIQKEMEALIIQKEAAIKKSEGEFNGFVAYGDDYRKHAQYQEAIDFYKKAESINPLNADLEKKITDTQIQLDKSLTPYERQKIQEAKAKADEANKIQEQFNSFVAYGDHYRSKQRYQDAMDYYKKAETISPLNTDLEQKIEYTQKELNKYVADSATQAYANSAYNSAPKPPYPADTYKKTATAPYPINPAYTPAGRAERTHKDSVERARTIIIGDMIKDGLIETTDNLSFKIGTREFIINGKKQPDDIYQKYRAKYVKLVGHGDWSWYYNYDTVQNKETNTTIDNTKKDNTKN